MRARARISCSPDLVTVTAMGADGATAELLFDSPEVALSFAAGLTAAIQQAWPDFTPDFDELGNFVVRAGGDA